jgi:alkylhydroperoxidase family enzyme
LARRLGAGAELLDAVTRGEYSGCEAGWRAAFAYADAITPTGGRADDACFAELRRHWSSAQIVELTAVAGLFNYFNRFAEALDIPVTR